MLFGMDHLVIAVADPDEAVEALASLLGTEPGGGGRHPGWGTWNRILWLGDTFIELLGIDDDELAARSWLGAPALATRAVWPALIGWAIATDDLEADRSRLRAAGASLGPPIDGERTRPDGAVVRWRLALPPEIALSRPFLIEHDTTAAEWSPADRAARAALPGRLVGLDLPVPTVEGIPPGAAEFAFGSQTVTLAGDAGEPTIHLRIPGRDGVSTYALGCRWAVE